KIIVLPKPVLDEFDRSLATFPNVRFFNSESAIKNTNLLPISCVERVCFSRLDRGVQSFPFLQSSFKICRHQLLLFICLNERQWCANKIEADVVEIAVDQPSEYEMEMGGRLNVFVWRNSQVTLVANSVAK